MRVRQQTATAEHQTAGELVDNDHLIVLDHVIHIAGHHAACLNRLVNMMQQRDVIGIHQVDHVEILLCLFHAGAGEGGGAGLFVHDVITVDVVLLLFSVHFFDFVNFEGFGEAVRLLIQIGGLVTLPGDDQRGARLVDEDGVHFVDDREMVAALHLVLLVDD